MHKSSGLCVKWPGASFHYFLPSEPERYFGSLPHCLRSRGVMVVMMVVVMLLMVA